MLGIRFTLFPKVKLVRLLQPANGLLPTEIQLSALNTTEVIPLQFWNAELPMEVTEPPMVTEVILLQPENAELPIEVTELGMVSVPASPLQPENA